MLITSVENMLVTGIGTTLETGVVSTQVHHFHFDYPSTVGSWCPLTLVRLLISAWVSVIGVLCRTITYKIIH